MDIYEFEKKVKSMLSPIDIKPKVCVFREINSKNEAITYSVMIHFSNELGRMFAKYIDSRKNSYVLLQYSRTPEFILSRLERCLNYFCEKQLEDISLNRRLFSDLKIIFSRTE